MSVIIDGVESIPKLGRVSGPLRHCSAAYAHFRKVDVRAENAASNLPHQDHETAARLLGNGNCWGMLGNHTGAMLYFDKALAIDPKYKGALGNKGDALNSLGKYKEAITYLDKPHCIVNVSTTLVEEFTENLSS